MKQIRVLQVISSLGTGGVEAMLINALRQMDTTKYRVDFLVHTNERFNAEIIEEFGGKVYQLENLTNLRIFNYIIQLYRLIKDNKGYDVVHAHIMFQNGIILLAAKLAGVQKRISHSHLTSYQRKLTKKISPIFRLLINMFATKKVACGKQAGAFLYKTEDFVVIPNGIDINRFIYAGDNRKKLEKIIDIDKDTKIIGHIGRFSTQKNHKHIIEIAKELKRCKDNFCIVLIGIGELQEEIEHLIVENALENNIILLGAQKDIPEWIKTFDVFILPSLYEGLPVVLVEAQAAGKKCVVSDTITREADMGLGLLEYVPLEDTSKWIEGILNKGNGCLVEDIHICMDKRNYNVAKSFELIQNLYM